jgi:hypothetical protein
LNERTRSGLERHGLLILSRLAAGPACPYEADLLRCLVLYGRACYQFDPVDKLLQIITAIEMWALRSDTEPISAAVSDRMAFSIAKDPGTRQEIARNFRAVYAIRSGRTHHGRTIRETEEIERFLKNVWVFFLFLINDVGSYNTRTDWLDQVDRIKYGQAHD